MEQEDESIGVKDYVWAKVKGHNWWPAEVKIPSILSFSRKLSYFNFSHNFYQSCTLFIGT